MVTRIKGRLVRQMDIEIRELGRDRALIVELTGREITLRLSGMQKRYTLALEPLYFKAVKQAVDEAEREKQKTRRARGKSKTGRR